MRAQIPTREEVKALEAAGLVTVRPHAYLPLVIVNYTPKAQYDRVWTPALLQCRGLVYNADWRLVARGLPKFFNYEEHLGENPVAGPLPSGPFEVTEKYDGSLGIVFRYGGEIVVATRGSFHSDQAREGYRILLDQYGLDVLVRLLDDEHTHLFEIIYPENRIVVDYGGIRALRWLTTIHTASGAEPGLWSFKWGGGDSRHSSNIQQFLGQERKNAEGYVLRFQGGQRVKIKHAEYVRLHAIVTGLSTVSVWEHLSAGGTLSTMPELPDELMAWARKVANAIMLEVLDLREAVKERHMDIEHRIGSDATRKAFAAEVMQLDADLRPLLFLTYDRREKELTQHIWKLVKPAYERPITADVC